MQNKFGKERVLLYMDMPTERHRLPALTSDGNVQGWRYWNCPFWWWCHNSV